MTWYGTMLVERQRFRLYVSRSYLLIERPCWSFWTLWGRNSWQGFRRDRQWFYFLWFVLFVRKHPVHEVWILTPDGPVLHHEEKV